MAALEVIWNPFDPLDPGPLIDVVISATDDTIEAGLGLGWEFPEPQSVRALIDTGSPFTIVSRTFARNRKLPQTNAGVPIKTLGGRYSCDEHSCSISFPGSDLPRIGTMRIVASDFNSRAISCLPNRKGHPQKLGHQTGWAWKARDNRGLIEMQKCP
jgi:hypothetical protein